MAGKPCKATKTNGQPCGGYSVGDGDYCYMHEPTRAKERAEARKQGGYNRRTAHAGDSSKLPAQVRTVADVYTLLDYTMLETIALDNSIIRTRALIALSECYLHALEVGELEARIAVLEANLECH
jgi:hypothetical protein